MPLYMEYQLEGEDLDKLKKLLEYTNSMLIIYSRDRKDMGGDTLIFLQRLRKNLNNVTMLKMYGYTNNYN